MKENCYQQSFGIARVEIHHSLLRQVCTSRPALLLLCSLLASACAVNTAQRENSDPHRSSENAASQDSNASAVHAESISLDGSKPRSPELTDFVSENASRYQQYIEQRQSRAKLTTSLRPKEDVTSHLNVRAEPFQDSKIIERLTPEESAKWIGNSKDGTWYEIELLNGSRGFVSALYSTKEAFAETQSNFLEVHFLQVGQGDSTIILCPNGKIIMVDGGSLSDDVESGAILDYFHELLDRNGPIVHTLIVTHPDEDHYNLPPELLEGIEVGHIYHADLDFWQYSYKSGFGKWIKSFPDNRRTRLTASYFDASDTPNDQIDCGAVETYILAAAIESEFSPKNTRSIVLMLKFGDSEVILTGDATKKTEEVILTRYSKEWLNADVLKLGHHGSSFTSTSVDWADTVKPEVSVASAGWNNGYGHPKQEIVDRVRQYAKESDSHHFRYASGRQNHYTWHHSSNYQKAIYNTATNGDIIVISDGSGYQTTWFFYGE